MSKQVMCITKRGDHYDPHERIQGIGGNQAGVQWWRDEDSAINDVIKDPSSYYVNVNNQKVLVVVASHNGRKYLKTERDGYAPNNLLNLSECPHR